MEIVSDVRKLALENLGYQTEVIILWNTSLFICVNVKNLILMYFFIYIYLIYTTWKIMQISVYILTPLIWFQSLQWRALNLKQKSTTFLFLFLGEQKGCIFSISYLSKLLWGTLMILAYNLKHENSLKIFIFLMFYGPLTQFGIDCLRNIHHVSCFIRVLCSMQIICKFSLKEMIWQKLS